MFQYFCTILYVHFRNSMEGKSTSGVGNLCAPHPLNKSLYMYRYITQYAHLVIFNNAADLKLLDAIGKGDKFSCRENYIMTRISLHYQGFL